jgi:hypothetical protein
MNNNLGNLNQFVWQGRQPPVHPPMFNNNVLNVVELVSGWRKCSLEIARDIVDNSFRRPEFIKEGLIFHMQYGAHHNTPVVLKENVSRLMHMFGGDIQPPAPPKAKEEEPRSKRARSPHSDSVHRRGLELEEAQLAADAMVVRQQHMQQCLAGLADQLQIIEHLGTDDDTKDMLRQLAIAAVSGVPPTQTKPTLIVSHLVREHLGYSPRQAYLNEPDGVARLFKEIGRRVKEQYLQLHGVAPDRMHQGVVGRETNCYPPSNKVWMTEIVAASCKEAACYPKPRVAMARGEKPFSSELVVSNQPH